MVKTLEFPYPLNLRWNYIQWYPVFLHRALRSRFALLSDLDVRGAAYTLFAAAMESNPPATLPTNHNNQASLLRISSEEWAELLSREISPLDGWVEIQCGKELRLTHPVLLEALEISVKASKLRQRGTTQRRNGQPPDAGRAPK